MKADPEVPQSYGDLVIPRWDLCLASTTASKRHLTHPESQGKQDHCILQPHASWRSKLQLNSYIAMALVTTELLLESWTERNSGF